MEHQPKPHFLVITFPAQGHLTPALHLAKRLAAATAADITFSTAAAAHIKMFPSLPSPSSPTHLDGITFFPFSAGSSSLPIPTDTDHHSVISQMQQVGSEHLASILKNFSSAGRPVTCLIYTIMLQWAADVAAKFSIPTAIYWIQSATVLSIYHHFFNGHDSAIISHAKNPSYKISLPSLPLFQIRDLPSFLTITSPDELFTDILRSFRDLFENLSVRIKAGERPRVLVNSFDELEMNALAPLKPHMELFTVGPAVNNKEGGETGDLFDHDESEYMEWLESKEEKSVVYVAFGSLHKLTREEVEEIGGGLY